MKENQMLDLRAHVGILFQEGALFDSLNIEENVAYPLVNQRVLQHVGSNGSSAAERRVEDRVRETLRFVELEHTLAKFPSELSGGMRRRVGIARAVVTEPALVVYGSPTAALDPIPPNSIHAPSLKERDQRKSAALNDTQRYPRRH